MNSETFPMHLLRWFRKISLQAALLALIAFQFAANAAAPFVQWAKVYGNPGFDYPQDMVLAPNGLVYLAGSFGSDVLLQFDQNGTLLGSQPYRGAYFQGVATDPAGNYYLTGLIRDSEQLRVGLTNHFYLAKYSSGGSLIWERTGGSPGDPGISYPWTLGGFKIALDAERNIYVAGGSTGPAVFGGITLPDSPGGPLLCKYAPDGTLLWVKRVEGTANFVGEGGRATGIALVPDGSIVLTGSLSNGSADFGGIVESVAGPYSADVFVAKFNPAGDVQWVRVGYGAEGIVADSQGNIYFTGTTAGKTEFHCGKFDLAGNLIWERRVTGAWSSGGVVLDGKEEPVFSANLIDTVQLDDLLVTYNGLGTIVESPVALICKANSAGRFQWAVPDSGKSMTWGGKILSDRKGNLYVAGAFRCRIEENCTSQFGSFSLQMLYPNANNNPDIFLVRLFDADAFLAELKIAKTPSDVVLSWPVEATNHVLEATTSLPAVSWTTVTNTPTVTTTDRSVQLPITGNARFFRLRQP
jgi:hypothetical protein